MSSITEDRTLPTQHSCSRGIGWRALLRDRACRVGEALVARGLGVRGCWRLVLSESLVSSE